MKCLISYVEEKSVSTLYNNLSWQLFFYIVLNLVYQSLSIKGAPHDCSQENNDIIVGSTAAHIENLMFWNS